MCTQAQCWLHSSLNDMRIVHITRQLKRCSRWNRKKTAPFSGHYLRNRSTLDIGVLGYIGILYHKEHSPEVWHIPPETPYIYIYIYTGYNRRNGPAFGRVFLMLYYTDITQNTYVHSRTVTEIIAREKCGLHRSRRTIRRPWRHTCPMRLPDNETL